MVLRTLQELYYIPEPKNLHLLIMCINYNIYCTFSLYSSTVCLVNYKKSGRYILGLLYRPCDQHA